MGNVVITGFNRTSDNTENLSASYARRIAKKPYKGNKIMPHIFALTPKSFDSALFEFATKHRAHIIILCDVQDIKKIKIETRARNYNYQETHPRITKYTAKDVLDYFKESFDTNIPMHKVNRIKKSMSFPTYVSKNAGNGLGNQLYYYCMYSIIYGVYSIPAIFYHLPRENFDYETYQELIQITIDLLVDEEY